MAFGDPFQQQHMIAGVKRAIASPNTPAHLRPHLTARLRGGTMQPMAPRKTIVGPTGQTPIKTTTSPYSTTPVKTVVGSTARPPIKTKVGSLAAPPRKTVVGATAAPPLKTTASNLGVGSNGPRPRGVLASPNSSANVNLNTRSLGRNDGNPGRSVSSIPGPAQGAENPVLDHDGDPGRTTIQAGGMGPTASRMSRQPRGSRAPRTRSQFFGE
jgi:hypothetical protein